jgi:uncharacterized membrane protein
VKLWSQHRSLGTLSCPNIIQIIIIIIIILYSILSTYIITEDHKLHRSLGRYAVQSCPNIIQIIIIIIILYSLLSTYLITEDHKLQQIEPEDQYEWDFI